MNTLIFGDVHLEVGPKGAKTQHEFTQFLRSINPEECDTIIILGDLFDFWFEYKHVVFSGYFEVLRAFADLRERGISLHLICGNHDFWAGPFLTQLGFTIHPDRYACNLGPHRALFVHGDGTNPKDYGYRIFKPIARWQPVICAFRLLHPDWAMALAQSVSHRSRRYRAPIDPSESKEIIAMQAYALTLLERDEADFVFCGHTHYPVREEFQTPNGTRTYINIGDWQVRRTYLVWDGKEVLRKSFGENSDDAGNADSE